MRQRCSAAAGLLRGGDEALRTVQPTARDVEFEQFKIAHYARQQVVEVVRDTAGELADGLHLLCLAELPFRGFQRACLAFFFRRVAADRDDLAIARSRVPDDVAVAAVLVAVAIVEARERMTFTDPARGGDRAFHIVGMDEGEERSSDQFNFRPAKRVGPGRIDRVDGSVEVGDEHDVGRQLPKPVAVRGACGNLLLERRVEFEQVCLCLQQRSVTEDAIGRLRWSG